MHTLQKKARSVSAGIPSAPRSAFTLVELLVVIAILAMLASLITMAASRAMTSARNAAIKAEIDTWRWAGVPFFLRSGKRMPEKLAEIVINFRPVPHPIFGEAHHTNRANRLIIRMQPDESMRLYLEAKQPGDAMALHPVNLNLDFAESFKARRLEAYERLLLDAMRGKLTLFVRRDEQEAAWRWVEPILDSWAANEDRPKSDPKGHGGRKGAVRGEESAFLIGT